MKAEELTVLDEHELADRLKASRRELYELRFQVAVGQLENHREIRKVKKDIARILTVIHLRELSHAEPAPAAPERTAPPPAGAVTAEAGEEEAEAQVDGPEVEEEETE